MHSPIRQNWLRSQALILISLAIILTLSSAPAASAQSGSIHLRVRRTAKQSLTLIKPSDPTFEDTLDTFFPGVSEEANYQTIRPYLLILQNNAPLPAVAYAIQWHLEYAGGVSGSFNRLFILRPLMYRPAITAIPSGGIRLVSPLFNLSPAQFQSLYGTNPGLFAREFAPSRFPHSPKLSSVYASVDGVVYKGGGFTGPDKTHIFQRYVAAQFAARDEALAALELLKSAQALLAGPELLQSLNQETQNDLRAQRSTFRGRYTRARGRSAEDLQRILRDRGLAGLERELRGFVQRTRGGSRRTSMFDKAYRKLSSNVPQSTR